jgi:hypothetical protein
MTYVNQLQRFKAQCMAAGISNVHGHCAATLLGTDWSAPPAQGGRSSRELTLEQKLIDHRARVTISAELDHAREQITTVYLSR